MRFDTVALVFLLSFALLGCSRESKLKRYTEKADAALQSGDYDQAEIHYLNVLRLDRSNSTAIRSLGLMSYEQGRLGQAFLLLSRSQKTAPGDFLVDLRLAQTLLAGGGAPQAREQAVALLARQPADEAAMLVLVESSQTTNQLRDAEQRLVALRSAAGAKAGFHVAQGVAQLRLQQFEAGEASFRRALALDTNSSSAHVALGNLHALRKELEPAADHYRRAAELAPARSPHRLQYADFRLRNGEVAEARNLLERIAKQTPDYLPAKLRLAQIAFNDHRWEDCKRLLQDVLGRDAHHLEAMLWMARLHSVQDQTAQALKLLEVAKTEYPRVAQVHYQAALVELKLDPASGAALGSLGRALSLQPNYPEATLVLAELNLRRGESAEAIKSLTELVARRPDVPGSYFLLAGAYQSAGKLAEALAVYQDFGRRFPRNPQVPLRIGMLHMLLGRGSEARQSYEAALAIAPQYSPAIEQLVNLDLAEGRLAPARQRAEQAVEREPAAAANHLLLARVFLAETNSSGAEKALLKAVEITPDSTAAHALLARIYVASNRQQEALQRLQQVVARQTNNHSAWLQIAQVYSATSNYTAAAEAYERLLAARPDFSPALNNLAWLQLEHLGNARLAQDLATKARKSAPEDPSSADTLAWAMFRTGDYRTARALITEAADKLPQNPDVQFHKGMIHYMLGEETESRAALQSALKLGSQEKWRSDAQQRLRVLDLNPASGDPRSRKETEDLLAQSPDDPIVQSRMAVFWESEHQWQKAAANYEKALELNPGLVPVMVELARLHSEHLNNTERALALARDARKIDPENPSVRHTLGKITYQVAKSAADFQQAYALLRENALLPGSGQDAWFDYAWAACSIGRMDEAVDAMKRVVQGSPASPHSAPANQFLQMLALLDMPSVTETRLEEAQALLQSDPRHLPASMLVAANLERKGDPQAAAEAYEQILQRFPLFSPVLKPLARLYLFALGDTDKAYTHASRARDAFPADPEVAKVLGFLEFERKAYARCAQLLAESARSLPDDAQLHYRLGMAWHQLKQPKEGNGALIKALQLDPQSPLATEARRLLSAAE